MATLCFYPPEICPTFTTTLLLNPYVSAVSINVKVLSFVATILISSIVASVLLYFIFSAKLALNRTGS
jgi:hypothetical protein